MLLCSILTLSPKFVCFNFVKGVCYDKFMLNTIWLTLEAVILSFGIWGIIFLIGLTLLHPIVEFPAALLIMTLLAVLLGSPWLAVLVMVPVHTLGMIIYYYLVRWLSTKTSNIAFRFKPTAIALAWIEKQPRWKHILVMGLPLVYTYPLRLGYTILETKIARYMLAVIGMELVLFIGNIILYYSLLTVFIYPNQTWFVSLVLIGLIIWLYQTKKILPKFR